MNAISVKELTPYHFCCNQDDPAVAKIAKALRWYGPDYSPHKVPHFYDVSSIVENPPILNLTMEVLIRRYKSEIDAGTGPTHVAGFEARGFLFGVPLAMALGIPFVMIRKANKLPGVLVSSGKYSTEYSTDETAIRLGSLGPGARVVLIDDLIATGGTALAGFELVTAVNAVVWEFAAIIAIPECEGIQKIRSYHNGVHREVRIFTVVDSNSVGEEQCGNPPPGTSRVYSLQDKSILELIPKLK